MGSLNSARFGIPFLAAGQAQKEVTHNEALVLIDAALHASVESAGLDTPPPDPDPGLCCIVGNSPAGAWAGQAGAIACWTEAGWRFVPAPEGTSAWLKEEQLWVVRERGGWVTGHVRAACVSVDGQQVIGSRGDAVASPMGGTTVDEEARSAIAAILDRLVAHGLIEA